jgi:glycerol-3-phosphate acyltransferase PlsY
MTNVWRVAGVQWGILTLALDILKGVVAVWIGGWYFNNESIRVLAGVCVLVGNLFPVFLKFKGGKGVGTSVGVFFSLLPIQSALGALVFGIAAWRWRMVSVGSLAGVTVMALASAHRYGIVGPIPRLALAACLLLWWSHRSNIGRILDGTENKIGLKPDNPLPPQETQEGSPT